MTPDEDELRRALEARSAPPSPEFRARLSQALSVRPRAGASPMPLIAFATVVVLSVTSVGVLVAARHYLGRTTGTAASGARVESPGPIVNPTDIRLSAPSTNVVWALVDYDHLYRSTDQGNQWEQRPMPAQFGVRPAISFIDEHEGWLLAPGSPTTQCQQAEAAIWHTSDGGATWRQLAAQGIASKQCKSGIWFFDSKQGVVSAWDDMHAASIYRTADGGKHWAATTLLPDPPNYQSQQGGVGYEVTWVKPFGASLYLAANGTPYIYRSTDGGASWKWFTKWPTSSVVMVTEMRWLDLSTPGQPMESVNGGQAFGPYVSDFNPDSANGTRLVFADPQVGYASAAGRLQRTTDGGAHWTRLATPGVVQPAPTPSVSPSPIPMPTDAILSAPSTNVVWALVAGQYLFRSTDQGTTWRQRSLPAIAPFTDISFVDDQNGWLLAAGPGATQCSFGPATLWRTTDGGDHWTIVSSVALPPASGARVAGSIGPEQCKENVSFVDSRRGFLDASDPNSPPTVYRTLDGGLTWSAGRLPDPPGFKTMAGGDSLRAGHVKAFGQTLLVEATGGQPDGEHDYVFESTDGGASWSYLSSPPQANSPEVELVTATRWLKLQSGLETTDAGITWHSFTSGYEDAAGVFSTFVFATDKVGYGTVRGGIHRTVDGGAHWELIKTSWP